jgi:hypothetical protein
MATEICKYGVNVHGRPRWTGGSWRRTDRYTSHVTGETFNEGHFAAGREDDSLVFRGKYDSACPCCYLNFSHTTEEHNQSTGRSTAKHAN